MTEEELELERARLGRLGNRVWRSRLAALLWFGLGAGFTWLAWRHIQELSRSRGAWETLIAALPLALYWMLLPVVLARGLGGLAVGRRTRFRLAFFSPILLSLAFIALQALSGERFSPLAGLDAAFVGAFLGSLAATAEIGGLGENNSPPSPAVQGEVERLHRQVSGSPRREPLGKRLFDISLSLLGLLLSAPVWLLSVLLIWLEDPGPVLFVKNSVGKGGVNFRQLKLRTMVLGAEDETGPVLSSRDDRRILRIGRLLRKTALDELPQLINILRGEMSFVGPRPQRTVLVLGYLERMPEYAERHRVLPGLAGLAQVAGDYYLTPRQKLRFDRVYIQHRSLGFDLKLIFLAFSIAFWYRWKDGWSGRLPRRRLHG